MLLIAVVVAVVVHMPMEVTNFDVFSIVDVADIAVDVGIVGVGIAVVVVVVVVATTNKRVVLNLNFEGAFGGKKWKGCCCY